MTTLAIDLLTWPLKGLYSVLGYSYFRTVDESVEPTANLILHANTTLHILAGDLCGDLWNQDRIKKALTKVAAGPRPPKIEIVFGPRDRADPDALGFLQSLAREGKLNLYATNPSRQPHFIVADELNVKIEDSHSSKDARRSGYIRCGDTRLASALEARFSLIKQSATLLSP